MFGEPKEPRDIVDWIIWRNAALQRHGPPSRVYRNVVVQKNSPDKLLPGRDILYLPERFRESLRNLKSEDLMNIRSDYVALFIDPEMASMHLLKYLIKGLPVDRY